MEPLGMNQLNHIFLADKGGKVNAAQLCNPAIGSNRCAPKNNYFVHERHKRREKTCKLAEIGNAVRFEPETKGFLGP